MQDSFRFQYVRLLAHSEAQFYSMRLRSLALTVYTGARCFLKYIEFTVQSKQNLVANNLYCKSGHTVP